MPSPRENALDQLKVGGDAAKGAVWALVYVGDRIAELVSAINQRSSDG